MAKIIYAIANPVSSRLVDKVHHWPGVEFLTAIDQDLPLVANKPLRFFDHNNQKRGMSPRVACKNKCARTEALQRNKAFIERYRDARHEKLAGRDVVFPAGTWWLHRFAGVKRAEPETTTPPARA